MNFSLTNLYGQNEIWFTPDIYRSAKLWGDSKGSYFKVDVTCAAPTVEEAVSNAKKIALYNYIFVGFDDAVAKLAESSVYEQHKDFFISYINEESKGLRFIEAKINVSQPASEVKVDKKKFRKVTTTITVKAPEIIKDLEAQGKIKSMADITKILGSAPIKVIIRPTDEWLQDLTDATGTPYIAMKDNQGKRVPVKDYYRFGKDAPYFSDIKNSITRILGDGFSVIDLAQASSNANASGARDLAREIDGGAVETSAADLVAKKEKATIFLDVLFKEAKIAGGTKKQFSLTISGVDAFTSLSTSMTGNTIRKETSSDDFNSLLDAALKVATNDFKDKALKFLVKRIEDGIPGKVEFRIGEGVDMKFSSEVDYNDRPQPLDRLLLIRIKKMAKAGAPAGSSSPTMMNYDVTIPARYYDQDLEEETNNDFDSFGANLAMDLAKYLPDYRFEKELVGLGHVVLIMKARD